MMRHRGIAALVIATALVSGCFQKEAPRLEAPVAARAASADLHGPQVPHRAESSAPGRDADDPDVRRESVYALADSGHLDDAAIIGQALYDPDGRVRLAAIEALTGIRSEASSDWLSIALGDPDPGIRRTAVEALGEIGGETARFLLQQALGDADAGVREAAQQMLDEPPRVARGIS